MANNNSEDPAKKDEHELSQSPSLSDYSLSKNGGAIGSVSIGEVIDVVQEGEDSPERALTSRTLWSDTRDRKLKDRGGGGGGQYVLYKRRWIGLVGLCILNIASAMNWVLFTAIANETSTHFNISLTEVNWLAIIVCAMYLVVSWFVPFFVEHFGLRITTIGASVILVIAAWLRYLAILPNSSSSQYALLFLGSILIGVSQSTIQVISPGYSEVWMSSNTRTTSTMLMAVANPFGGAIADIIAPALISDESKSGKINDLLLVMGVVSSVLAMAGFLVGGEPPTPPSASAERLRKRKRQSGGRSIGGGTRRINEITGEEESSFKAFGILIGIGQGKGWKGNGIDDDEMGMRRRDRIDFWIISEAFAALLAFFCSFTTLINQIFEPQGYSSDAAGFFGAAMIIAGLIAAIVTAPIMDRVFSYRLALAGKILVPIISITYLCLIWAVKPNDYAGIYILLILNGACSFTMLPIALELAAEVAYPFVDPNTTSALLYLLGNGLSVVSTQGMDSLRASSNAHPSKHMKRSLIFEGVVTMAAAFPVFFLKGRQRRREADERRKVEEQEGISS